MVKYTSSILAAANLLALAQALPAQPVCSVIVQYVTGQGVWVPQADPTWGSWDPSSSKTPVATSTASWSAWEDPSKPKTATKSTTSADWNTWGSSDPSKNTKTTTKSTNTSAYEWASWTSSASVSAKTTTTKVGGGFYTSSKETTSAKPTTYSTDYPTTTPKATTSAEPSTTTASTTTTTASTTTTTAVEQPAPTCPYYDKSYHLLPSVTVGGSCGGSYDVNCGARVTNIPQDGSVKFWQRADETIETLEDCLKICDENAACTAVFWTNYSGAQAADYKHCYQTSGLPQPDLKGGENQYAQLSYKTSSSGDCAQSYINV